MENEKTRIFKPALIRIMAVVAVACTLLSPAPLRAEDRVATELHLLVERMEHAFEGVKDYRALLHVETYRNDGSIQRKRLKYAFKKPDRVRVDFLSPHRGMILVFPTEDHKVRLRPPGFLRFLDLTVDPGNSFIEVSPGQRIDQTDLGLLIRNIGRSLTDLRRGPVTVHSRGGTVSVTVLSENHFRKGVITLYTFQVDTALWLPVKVQEATPEGRLERVVLFQALEINVGISRDFFKLK